MTSWKRDSSINQLEEIKANWKCNNNGDNKNHHAPAGQAVRKVEKASDASGKRPKSSRTRSPRSGQEKGIKRKEVRQGKRLVLVDWLIGSKERVPELMNEHAQRDTHGFLLFGLGSSYYCHDIIVMGFVDVIVLAQ
jgi:hypothetical protein